MATVHHWTGLEARALRHALRMSVRAFAQHLGLAVATVSKWESKLAATEPRPDTQAILDTALGKADASVHLRFETLLCETTGTMPAGPRAWEYESWTDDLDRVVVALSRQNFTFADSLLDRWLARFKPAELDEKGLYLFARSTALLGDLKRYQGTLGGLLSAQHSYASARAVFTQLGIPRRVAQLDLALAVVMEMSGKLEIAARTYEALAADDRLLPRPCASTTVGGDRAEQGRPVRLRDPRHAGRDPRLRGTRRTRRLVGGPPETRPRPPRRRRSHGRVPAPGHRPHGGHPGIPDATGTAHHRSSPYPAHRPRHP